MQYSTDRRHLSPIKKDKEVFAKVKSINKRALVEGHLANLTPLSANMDKKEVLNVFLPFASGVLQAAMELGVNCDTN